MSVLRSAPPLRRRTSPPRLRQWDWLLVLPAATLCLLGAALIWSATSARLAAEGQWSGGSAVRHLMNLALGLVLCGVVSRLGHRAISRYTPMLYAASLAGLVLVLSPAGSTINGAQAWIRLPAGFTIQPSEFAKVAIIVGVALVLADRSPDEVPAGRTVVRALGLAALPVGLIMLQPDLGTVLVIVSIVVGMLVVAGIRMWQLALLGVAGIAAVAAAFALGLVDDYQIDRLTAFARPDQGARTFGYNTQQARIAIGAGGLLGRGLGHGTQTQGGFVPFNHTDFVFSVAGEELGFLGVGVLLGLLALVLWRALLIALRARDLFGRMVASGVVLWFGLQSFENVGMNLGIMPVTGVPLPFVSYGGSSMFAAWIGIGLLLNIHAASTSDD
ncbi:MAG: rod shape-determining protein RodA [Candidatus Nanopelagicales bacterium]